MRKFLLLPFLLILFLFIQCSKESSINQLSENTLLSDVPRYDKINIKKDFKYNNTDYVDQLQKKKAISRYYEEFWEKSGVSGGLLIAQNGKILFEKYSGQANFESGVELNENTPIHIASISKVLTALAILKLIEYDRLTLDQSVSTILTKLPFKDITVRDLLSHRSGLTNYAYFVDEEGVQWDKSIYMTNRDVLDILASGKIIPAAKPNKKFIYSNTNYVLLALIIEEITDMKYPQAMKYMIFDPLKMKNTYVFDIVKDIPKATPSYGFGGKKWDIDFLDGIYGDKNIYSTPQDLLNLDMAMYSNKFLPAHLKEEQLRGYSYEYKGVKNYGLGFRMMEFDENRKLWYHNGWWHGNYTVYVRGQKEQFTIIALGNKQNKNIYSAFKLSSILGDYPIALPGKFGDLNTEM